MKTDETLKLHVVEQLDWDPSVNAANIGVKVKDCVVTLEGQVDSYAEKLEAIRITKTVSGVQGLTEELEVVLIPAPGRSDSDIARAAINALEWNTLIPENTVKVMVQDGHVTLEGELDWQYQRTAVDRAVRYLNGVKSLKNAITLKPRNSPEDIKARIVAALRRTSESDARDIRVETDAGRAILSGSVHSFAARDEAERAVWAAPGITWVEDHITIKPNLAII